jgi:hypothetical protein
MLNKMKYSAEDEEMYGPSWRMVKYNKDKLETLIEDMDLKSKIGFKPPPPPKPLAGIMELKAYIKMLEEKFKA